VPADIHRHYGRESGVYFKLAEPMRCCGREYMRADEVILLDQCMWCWEDHGTLVPSMASRLVYPIYSPQRPARRKR
jgi:hypothetical protein